MLQYAAKRLLLIPPTFFFVSLILFFVMNIAPGRPGQQAQGQGERTNQAQRESYRIFKEQFNLDKPILWNTRFALSEDRVIHLLRTANGLDADATMAARVGAQNELEDLGNDAVRHLIAVLAATHDPVVARLAAAQLSQAAQRSLVSDRAGRDAGARDANRVIARQNAEVRDLKWDAEAPVDEQARVKAAWKTWWATNQGAFTYTAGEKVRAFFLETRFARYWANLAAFDFGRSTVDRQPVLPTIVSKFRYSLSLTLISVLLAYLIAIPIGIWSAVRANTAADTVSTVILFVLYSLPTFFIGTLLLRLLTQGDPVTWFPSGDFESMDAGDRTTLGQLADITWHLVLPVATYTMVSLAALSRYARTGIIDVIRADYIRTARAKGLSEPVVIIKHAARNGMIPILTLLGSLLPVLVSGSVVIEVIFNIPGMGLYLYDAINLRDYNVVMGVLLMASVLTLLGILLSDLSYALADPRITFD
jgi:peptide/nickel transport system permease protein